MDQGPDRWTLPDWPATLTWCQMRNSQGIRCIIDVLGEYASTRGAINVALAAYKDCIKQIHQNKLQASISIKLSALGAMFDTQLCKKNALGLAREALRGDVGFEIDMEGKQSVDLTIDVAKTCAAAGVPVTMALQAYLKRTMDDLDHLSYAENLRLRLVKGAYVGDDLNYSNTRESFKILAQEMARLARPYCIGTHDSEILDWLKISGFVDTSKTEFGFLKGLAYETKLAFVKNKLLVSEYVPFGKESGPYVARRLRYLHDLEELNKSPAP